MVPSPEACLPRPARPTPGFEPGRYLEPIPRKRHEPGATPGLAGAFAAPGPAHGAQSANEQEGRAATGEGQLLQGCAADPSAALPGLPSAGQGAGRLRHDEPRRTL